MRKQMMNLEQDHYKDSEHDNEFQTLQADGYDSDPYDDCSPVRLEEDEGENQDLIIQRQLNNLSKMSLRRDVQEVNNDLDFELQVNCLVKRHQDLQEQVDHLFRDMTEQLQQHKREKKDKNELFRAQNDLRKQLKLFKDSTNEKYQKVVSKIRKVNRAISASRKNTIRDMGFIRQWIANDNKEILREISDAKLDVVFEDDNESN